MDADTPIDIHFHNTYLVIAHFHIGVLAASFMALAGGIYALFPQIFKRRIYRVPGIIHFIITLAYLLLVIWPVRYHGIAGAPRHYYDYSSHHAFNEFAALNTFIAGATVLCFLAQLIFILNLVISAVAGRKGEGCY